MTPAEAVAAVREAFQDVPRPKMFIRGTCLCDECVEHNETLAAHTPEDITMEHLGHPAWDPICAASDQAFAYYLPAMVRLALEEGYWDQLLFHLNIPGRLDTLTQEQRRALRDALWVLAGDEAGPDCRYRWDLPPRRGNRKAGACRCSGGLRAACRCASMETMGRR